jgi:hypothetical protein
MHDGSGRVQISIPQNERASRATLVHCIQAAHWTSIHRGFVLIDVTLGCEV